MNRVSYRGQETLLDGIILTRSTIVEIDKSKVKYKGLTERFIKSLEPLLNKPGFLSLINKRRCIVKFPDIKAFPDDPDCDITVSIEVPSNWINIKQS